MTPRVHRRALGSGPTSSAVGAVVLALLLTLVACTAPGSKAGPDPPATVLHLATVEARGAPYTKDVEFFTERVGTLTEGSVQVVVDYEAITWTPTAEQDVVALLRREGTDLALVPTRVFDTVGITGFEALQTPMLIDSPELAGRVAAGDLAERLLAGLENQRLVGLGLVYEGLRRPLALNGAVTRATDLEGLRVRVPISNLSDRVFAALGAEPDHGASHATSTTGARYPVVETELALAATDFAQPSTATMNLALFPKYDAIVAATGSFARLTESQQQAVRQAAAETVAASTRSTADEERLAATFCEAGGALAFAPEHQLAAFRRRLQPITLELRRERRSAEVIDAVTTLKESVAAPRFRTPGACLPPRGDGARLPSEPAAPRP